MSRRVLSHVIAMAALAALAGCGFHLRGVGSAALPPALATVRVVSVSGAVNDPLVVAVRQAVAQAGAQVVDTGNVPTVVVSDERVDSDVISVQTTTAKASEYRLRYSMSFRLDGPQPLETQTLRVQRDYTLDANRVLAKEQEERELVRTMRQEAAQQLIRRIARAARQP